ncbi:MAG TPA: NYN domain-containing protein [Acidimicrobiales bacterium]|nr:NYN domain-containing protein [Acidimicrobiales bacterium]
MAEGLGPDGLVRSAVEAAVVVARRGVEADPPVPVPRGLRPFLRFTRLPDRAVDAARRVLDDDAEFRNLVRQATSEDLVGRASWLFLDRPEGWEEELEAIAAAARAEHDADSERQAESSALRRLASVEDARRQADGLVARLQAELAEAKEQLAAERRSRHRVETEAGRLRRRTSEVEDEVVHLRAAAADLQDAVRARDHELRDDVGTDAIASEPGLFDATAEEEANDEATIDRQALAAAYAAAVAAADTLVVALVELGRGIAPYPAERSGDDGEASPSPLPASQRAATRRQPVPLPPAVHDDSVEAAEHLLRVDRVLVLVDGYNVTKRARPELALAEQRRWLVDAALESATRTGARFELVFDGVDDLGTAPADLGRRSGVQVRFSPASVEADDVVLGRVAASGAFPVVVASDDRRVRDGARALGANVVGARQLLAALRRPLDR